MGLGVFKSDMRSAAILCRFEFKASGLASARAIVGLGFRVQGTINFENPPGNPDPLKQRYVRVYGGFPKLGVPLKGLYRVYISYQLALCKDIVRPEKDRNGNGVYEAQVLTRDQLAFRSWVAC